MKLWEVEAASHKRFVTKIKHWKSVKKYVTACRGAMQLLLVQTVLIMGTADHASLLQMGVTIVVSIMRIWYH